MDRIPSKQNAIVADSNGQLMLVNDLPLPEMEPDMVVVKNHVVGLNPADYKMTGRKAHAGAVAGHDFAGTVVAIGPNVRTIAPLTNGDRVLGAVPGVHSLTPRAGAFAQYTCAPDYVLLKIPSFISFEEAVTFGASIGTVGMALFRSLQVPGYPMEPASRPGQTVLVYGGSTATGTLALQILKLSGLKPIATASPKNFDLVKSYGAEAVFDYHAQDFVAQIKTYTKSSLKYIIDCVSTAETMELCYSLLGRTGGKLTTLEAPPSYIHTRPGNRVSLDWVVGPSIHGRALGWPPPMAREPDMELEEFSIKWFTTAQRLLDDGKLRAHPVKSIEGLEGVLKGLDSLRKGEISGHKLVCRIQKEDL
ncbi:zinc-binding dehydrogenase family oxidoreductase [Stachybotrys elegans]|uniref:Zinc-binding dehydrogenase family oxidoreductase n=1 Tax=Stachybotrys elegans TaxID=80388 RepID=A0A8K0WIF6_9HYPO|nr:zinc-binding dehydrogenase family oxidoreductase [Stachybotrys elegans]